MFVVWYAVPVAGMMSSCSAMPDVSTTSEYLPGHLVPGQFPGAAAELARYDAVILSDIGANSLLLSPDTFERSAAAPNRLEELDGTCAAAAAC